METTLPLDNDGDIITSADFGYSFLVQVEYNTDYEGRTLPVHVEETPTTLHGPFVSKEEAELWMESYPDTLDVSEMSVIYVNNVR